MTTLPDFTPLPGGVPILQDGLVIGAVGASGVAAARDEEIALAGAATLVPEIPKQSEQHRLNHTTDHKSP